MSSICCFLFLYIYIYMIPEKNPNQSVDWPNCKSHKASHVPRGQGHIRLHQVKVTSGHIRSQQVTSGRPRTGHGFAHQVTAHRERRVDASPAARPTHKQQANSGHYRNYSVFLAFFVVWWTTSFKYARNRSHQVARQQVMGLGPKCKISVCQATGIDPQK